jgi:hypothetical protein
MVVGIAGVESYETLKDDPRWLKLALQKKEIPLRGDAVQFLG